MQICSYIQEMWPKGVHVAWSRSFWSTRRHSKLIGADRQRLWTRPSYMYKTFWVYSHENHIGIWSKYIFWFWFKWTCKIRVCFGHFNILWQSFSIAWPPFILLIYTPWFTRHNQHDLLQVNFVVLLLSGSEKCNVKSCWIVYIHNFNV